MQIKNLYLKNFRNYKEQNFEFSNGFNILTGSNAQGKTNCAEAVYFLCTGYSPRAGKDKEIIMQGENKSVIEGRANTSYGDTDVEIEILSDGKKEIKINGVKVLKMGELLGNINSVFFNPSELKIVQESPEDRRRFMDLALSQMSKSYYYSLLRYKKILAQRNNLLKYPNEKDIIETLPIWDEHLSIYGGEIIKLRTEFLESLKPYAKEAHSYLTDNSEDLEIGSEIKYSGDIAKCLLNDLKKAYSKDIRLGFTTVGPHRDDIKIHINGMDVKTYGSQGQKRTAALSIKLAETEFFKNRTGEYPILILDDVLSELDRKRKKKLLDKVKNIQVILTCTEKERFLTGLNYREFKIENGSIKSFKDIEAKVKKEKQ
jgi:DNA replication and repair protein RecF